MLLLSFEVALGPGRELPEHLGGALHGLVDTAAALSKGPALSNALRPRGLNHAPAYAVQAPPWGQPVDRELRFGVLLFGAAATSWLNLVQTVAIHAREHRIHGRQAVVVRVNACSPGHPPLPVIENESLLLNSQSLPPASTLELPDWGAGVDADHSRTVLPALHDLEFRSPLLVASRDAARTRFKESGKLPWPALGTLLLSIADRLRQVAPDLADRIGADSSWFPDPAIAGAGALTPVDSPARQILWPYKGYELPGIVGRLVYPASADPVEHRLLYWGTWVGAGQKTSMGCGAFVLR